MITAKNQKKLKSVDVGQRVIVELYPNVNTSDPPQAIAHSIKADEDFEPNRKAVAAAIKEFQKRTDRLISIESISCSSSECLVSMRIYNTDTAEITAADLNGNIVDRQAPN
jgi:hypothetical protein